MPFTDFRIKEKYEYQSGFGSYHETEAIPNTLPIGQNSPQKPAYGLYAEKLSGTSFTTPRHSNQQAWLYRILPAASHSPFTLVDPESAGADPRPWSSRWHHIPNQLRWDPFDINESVSYVSGLRLVAGAGDPSMKSGLGMYIFSAGKSMEPNEAFYSADGDLLLVLQHGAMDLQTELGRLMVRPNEIVVIPRGIRHRVDLVDGPIRGYALEVYQSHFTLPELGPIGTNGLANSRDFQAPVASYVHDVGSEWKLFAKFNGQLFEAKQGHTPFDVVAWHGNYYPYKYDLGRFNTIGSISFDHPDPSIFTVLSAMSDTPGVAIADFVIFPPRWLVQENTFRPPYYHRNTMSEFMGLIGGNYDAKAGGSGGFQPAGASLHNVMSAHGPDAVSHKKASEAPLEPRKEGASSMAFMFESCLMVGVTDWGLKECQKVQEKYNAHSWEPLKSHFSPPSTDGV